MIPTKPKACALSWLLGLALAVTCATACSAPQPSSVRVPVANVPRATADRGSQTTAVAEGPQPAPPAEDPWAPTAPETPPKQTFAETLRGLDPGFRYEMAEAITAYGEASAEGREAYALALTFLDAFPTDHPFARDAARLESELVMRQQLAGADELPVSDAEQAAFLAKVISEANSQPASAR